MAEPEEPVEKPTRETLEDKFPDVDMPHLQAVIQLLYATGNEIDDIEFIDASPYVRVEVGGEEWLVMSDGEADEYVEEDIGEMFDDMGMEGFNVNWPDFIENAGDFDTALAESVDSYIENIRDEAPSDPSFATRLDEEMTAAGAANEEEFEDYLASQWVPDGDNIQWYINEFGMEAFKELANIDTTALAKHVVETDGRGQVISSYDGEEVDLSKGYYGYRLS